MSSDLRGIFIRPEAEVGWCRKIQGSSLEPSARAVPDPPERIKNVGVGDVASSGPWVEFYIWFLAGVRDRNRRQSSLAWFLGDLVPFLIPCKTTFPLLLISHSVSPQEFLQFRKLKRKARRAFWRRIHRAV